MARKTPNKRTLQIVMPSETYAAMQAHVAERSKEGTRVFVSDIVREALRSYFTAAGMTLNFDVDRGGYRGRKSTKTSKTRTSKNGTAAQAAKPKATTRRSTAKA